jgi:hypothetical protein
MHKNKDKRNYGISPALFLIHAFLFSTLALFNLIPKDVYIFWRDLVFLHAITIFLTTGIVAIKLTGGKK